MLFIITVVTIVSLIALINLLAKTEKLEALISHPNKLNKNTSSNRLEKLEKRQELSELKLRILADTGIRIKDEVNLAQITLSDFQVFTMHKIYLETFASMHGTVRQPILESIGVLISIEKLVDEYLIIYDFNAYEIKLALSQYEKIDFSITNLRDEK